MSFVNFSEGLLHDGVCLWCLTVFDKRESKREHYCSLYCERTYKAATAWQIEEASRAEG
jgi:hypothetical protein